MLWAHQQNRGDHCVVQAKIEVGGSGEAEKKAGGTPAGHAARPASFWLTVSLDAGVGDGMHEILGVAVQ